MKFGFDLGLVDRLLFLCDLQVVLVLLLSRFIFGPSFVFSHFFYFIVQFLLLGPKKFKFLLLQELLCDIIREVFVLEILKLVLEAVVPIHKVLFVFLDLTLVTFHIWVVLELTAKFTGRLLEILCNSLNDG